MYKNHTDHLSNNLWLNEMSILTFFQFYFKINRNQLERVVKVTYGLHPNKCLNTESKIFRMKPGDKTCWASFKSLSRWWEQDLPITIDFRSKNIELLLLFSTISPSWLHDMVSTCLITKVKIRLSLPQRTSPWLAYFASIFAAICLLLKIFC